MTIFQLTWLAHLAGTTAPSKPGFSSFLFAVGDADFDVFRSTLYLNHRFTFTRTQNTPAESRRRNEIKFSWESKPYNILFCDFSQDTT